MPPSDRHARDAANQARPAFAVPSNPDDRGSAYLVHEAHLPIGDDYVVELDPGGVAYRVDGQLLSVRESLTLTDVDGAEVLHIQGTVLGARDVLAVSRAGVTVATVRKHADESGSTRYEIELPKRERVDVVGDPAERAYRLTFRDVTVATTSKARGLLRGGYRVRIEPAQDDVVVLAVTICLDVMSR